MLRYRKLWSYFLDHEAAAFEEERGLSVKDIKRIGIKKFVYANDWKNVEDVGKWKTDAFMVIPCPHCKRDFGVLDYTLGLCKNCLPKYNLRSFYEQMNDICGVDQDKSGRMLTLFLSVPEIRKTYIKEKYK